MVKWISSPPSAQVAIGVLIVIVIRSIGEFFLLGGSAGAPLTGEQVFYIEGALAAACAALIVLVLHALRRHAAAVVFTVAAIVGLIVWKAAIH
jgi:hypothetical protein